MERGKYGIRVWTWYGAFGAIMVLCTLTVATAAMHHLSSARPRCAVVR